MIKVLIADDEAIMREIINDYLAYEENISVVGEARDGQSAIVQARGLHPDIILMDMQMPGIDGVEATSIIHQELPDVRILGLSTFATDRYVVNLLHAGASGYLVKSSSPKKSFLPFIQWWTAVRYSLQKSPAMWFTHSKKMDRHPHKMFPPTKIF